MQTIVWDVDDVLNDLMRLWLEMHWLPRNPATSVTYEDLKTNPPHAVLGVPLEAYLSSLDAFRLSEAYLEMQPLPEVLSWFSDHGSRFHHAALTAVPLHAAHRSAWWVMKYFGRWIRTYHFVPSRRPGESAPTYDDDKASVLSRMGGVRLFVDDNEENLRNLPGVGVPMAVFPRPWNRNRGQAVDAFLSALLTQD